MSESKQEADTTEARTMKKYTCQWCRAGLPYNETEYIRGHFSPTIQPGGFVECEDRPMQPTAPVPEVEMRASSVLVTDEQKQRYRNTLAELDEKLKPMVDANLASERITADDLNIIVGAPVPETPRADKPSLGDTICGCGLAFKDHEYQMSEACGKNITTIVDLALKRKTPETPRVECGRCGGTGEMERPDMSGEIMTIRCPYCKGTGQSASVEIESESRACRKCGQPSARFMCELCYQAAMSSYSQPSPPLPRTDTDAWETAIRENAAEIQPPAGVDVAAIADEFDFTAPRTETAGEGEAPQSAGAAFNREIAQYSGLSTQERARLWSFFYRGWSAKESATPSGPGDALSGVVAELRKAATHFAPNSPQLEQWAARIEAAIAGGGK